MRNELYNDSFHAVLAWICGRAKCQCCTATVTFVVYSPTRGKKGPFFESVWVKWRLNIKVKINTIFVNFTISEMYNFLTFGKRLAPLKTFYNAEVTKTSSLLRKKLPLFCWRSTFPTIMHGYLLKWFKHCIVKCAAYVSKKMSSLS